MKDFKFTPKTKGNRVYHGHYGDGTVITVHQNRGRTRRIYIDKKPIDLPDPLLKIKFDRHQDPVEQFDSDVGLLVKE